MLRDTGAGIAGLAVAIVIIMAIQAVGHAIWPPPESLDWNDTEVVRTYVSQLPFPALLFPILSYFLGALAGPIIASIISTARPIIFAGIIGLVLLAFTIANLIQIPHPHWFSALAIAAVLLGSWLAMNIASHKKS
jgi:hypothetical protein